MIATVTNLSSTASVKVPHPFKVTLAPSGSVSLGVNMADLEHRALVGDPSWKRINRLIAQGKISVTLADDTNTRDVYDRARNT